jgi:hypothetical protein
MGVTSLLQCGVLAVRVRDEQENAMLLATEPEIFFTEPLYTGFPAVLIRLSAVDPDDLKNIMMNAWTCQAPLELIRRMDQSSEP